MPPQPFPTPASLAALLAGLCLPAASGAANRTVNFDIPAQPLNQALMAFGRQSGQQLLYRTHLAEELQSRALKGRYTPEEGARILLAEAQLQAVSTGSGAMTLAAREKPAASRPEESPDDSHPVELELEKITVTDDARRNAGYLERKDYRVRSASTATKIDVPLLETPVSVQVVPSQVIRDRGMQTPNDLAETVAGVQPVVGYGNAPSQWFLIRGFSNDALNFRNGYRLTEKYTPRDLANVERVEFAKGPASVLYGTSQPGGAVNTVTKKPLDIDFLSTRLTGGSFGRFRGSIDANKVVGNFAFRLNVAGDTSDSYFNFQSSQNWFIAPVVTYQITPDTKILYEAEFQETQQRGWANGLPNLPASLRLPVERTMSEPFTYLNNFNHSHHLELEHRFNQDWRFRQGFYYSRTGRSFLSINSDFSRNPAYPITAVPRFAYQSPDEHQRNIVAQTEVYGHFATGEVEHDVLAGFETIHSLFGFVADFSAYDTIDLANPVYGGPVPGPATSFGSRDTADSNAVYLQDQLKWGDWRLLAGWRHDEVDTESRDPFSSFRSRQTDSADTGRAGLLYMITPETSVYYSFSQSFVPNLGVDAANRPFEPDRGTQHEVGVKHSLWKGLDLTLALFDITRENVVVQGPDNIRVNFGQQNSRGAELSLTGDVSEDFHLISNFTWLDAKVEKHPDPNIVGDRLFGVPHFSANAWALYDWSLPIPGKLSTGFGVVHSGRREATLENYNLKLPAFTRLDLGVFYRLDGFNLALNMRNLTDVKYYETLENFAVQAQAPVNWAITVGYDFQ